MRAAQARRVLTVPGPRAVTVLLATAMVICATVTTDAPLTALAPVEWRATWSMPFDPYVGPTVTHDLDLATPLFAASDQAVAVARKQGGVTVHDPGTGRAVRFIPAPPGLPSSVSGVWIAAKTLIVSRSRQNTDSHTLTGYDLRTGAQRWQRTITVFTEAPAQVPPVDPAQIPLPIPTQLPPPDPSQLPPPDPSQPSLPDPTRYTGRYDGPRIMATEGGVVIVERSSEPLLLHSVDPLTGATTARMTHPSGCDVKAASTAGSVLLLSFCQDRRLRLASLDPRPLRHAWTRPLSSIPPPDDLHGDSRPHLRNLSTMDIRASADGYVYVWGGLDAEFYGPDGSRLSTVREAVKVTDSNRRSLPLFTGSYPAVGREGELVLHSGWPTPAYLLSLDTSTGRLGGLPIDVPYDFASLVGATATMAYVRSDLAKTTRITAYTLVRGAPSGPAMFGGVVPESWPDACALLTGADLRSVGDGYVAVPLGGGRPGARVPKAPECTWVPATDDGTTISLSVDWVSPSPAFTRKLFADSADELRNSSSLPPARIDPSTEGPGFLTYSGNGPSGRLNGTILAVGPVMATLRSSSRMAVRLLSARLRDNLMARYQPGVRFVPRASIDRWNHPADAGISTGPVVADGVVYVGSDDGKVHALDGAAGSVRWSFSVGPSMRDGLGVRDGVVYALGSGGRTAALDAATGRTLWSRRTGATLGLVVTGHGMYAATDDSDIVALDDATGKERWRFRPDRTVVERRLIPYGVPFAPVVAGGSVYVGGDHGTVYALNARSGARRWRFRPAEPRARMELTVANGIVYAFSLDGDVRALDGGTGAVRWSSRLGSRLLNRFVVAGDVVHLGDTDGVIHALDAATGKRLWRFRAETSEDAGLHLAAGRGLTYVVGADGTLHALDTSSGATRWSTPVDGGAGAHPVVLGDTVYIGGQNGMLHALNARTGASRWSYATAGFTAFAPVVADGTVYVGDWNGNVYALPK